MTTGHFGRFGPLHWAAGLDLPSSPTALPLSVRPLHRPSRSGVRFLVDRLDSIRPLPRFEVPVITFAAVKAEDFKEFSEPGHAKHVYSLSVHPLDGGRTLLRGEMRAAVTDEHARALVSPPLDLRSRLWSPRPHQRGDRGGPRRSRAATTRADGVRECTRCARSWQATVSSHSLSHRPSSGVYAGTAGTPSTRSPA